jgi:hypothetical protein
MGQRHAGEVLFVVFEVQIPDGVFVSFVLFFLRLFGDVSLFFACSLLLQSPQLLHFFEHVLWTQRR